MLSSAEEGGQTIAYVVDNGDVILEKDFAYESGAVCRISGNLTATS